MTAEEISTEVVTDGICDEYRGPDSPITNELRQLTPPEEAAAQVRALAEKAAREYEKRGLEPPAHVMSARRAGRKASGVPLAAPLKGWVKARLPSRRTTLGPTEDCWKER